MSKSLLEQGRAAYAFAQVASYLKGKGEKEQGEYRSYLKKLPAMVQMNGLGETLAFYFSKGKTHRDIYQQISSWLRSQYGDRFEDREVLEEIVNMTSSDYRMMAVEVVALTNWMRRFADGLVK